MIKNMIKTLIVSICLLSSSVAFSDSLFKKNQNNIVNVFGIRFNEPLDIKNLDTTVINVDKNTSEFDKYSLNVTSYNVQYLKYLIVDTVNQDKIVKNIYVSLDLSSIETNSDLYYDRLILLMKGKYGGYQGSNKELESKYFAGDKNTEFLKHFFELEDGNIVITHKKNKLDDIINIEYKLINRLHYSVTNFF